MQIKLPRSVLTTISSFVQNHVRLNVIKQGVMITNSAIICSDDSILNLSNEKKSRNKEIDIM